MALDVYFVSDLRAAVLAGMVATITTAHASGQNVEYLRGALCAFQHQALNFGIDWPALLSDARRAIGQDVGELLSACVVVEIES